MCFVFTTQIKHTIQQSWAHATIVAPIWDRFNHSTNSSPIILLLNTVSKNSILTTRRKHFSYFIASMSRCQKSVASPAFLFTKCALNARETKWWPNNAQFLRTSNHAMSKGLIHKLIRRSTKKRSLLLTTVSWPIFPPSGKRDYFLGFVAWKLFALQVQMFLNCSIYSTVSAALY